MSKHSRSLRSRLNEPWRGHVDQSAHQFDHQLQRDEDPSLEQRLSDFEVAHPDAPPEVRQALLAELLPCVIDHAAQVEERWPTVRELQLLFPSLSRDIKAVYPLLSLNERLPEWIGNYFVLEQIKVGGQACLAVGTRKEIHARKVALKFAKRETGEEDQLQLEARALRHLNQDGGHPNVIPLIEEIEDDEVRCLVLPYLEGDSLRDLPERSPREIAEIAVGIAKALQFVHDRGYLHLDISCGNIFLERDVDSSNQAPILLDFGFAVRCKRGIWPRGRIDWRGATEQYDAPEQKTSDGQVSERTDVFRLGAVLGWAYNRVYATDLERFRGLIEKSDLPDALKIAILKATEPHANNRFQSAREMQAAFAAYLETTSPTPPPKKAHRSRLMTTSSICGIVLIALAFAIPSVRQAIFPLSRGDQTDRTDSKSATTNSGEKPAVRADQEFPKAAAPARSKPRKDIPTIRAAIAGAMDLELALIPAGSYQMGVSKTDPQAGENERPQHKIVVPNPIYVSTAEITVDQFHVFVDATKHKTDGEKLIENTPPIARAIASLGTGPITTWKEPGFPQTDEHPVVNVSWNDAQQFCQWLSDQHGRTYRLLTEAEWEYVCRARTETVYSFGDDPNLLPKYGNAAGDADGFAVTAPVRSFQPNAFGLFDMHGNVAELCHDWYAEDYYAKSPPQNPTGPATGEFRVWRGGSHISTPEDCRAADRNGSKPIGQDTFVGFRVAADFTPESTEDAPEKKRLQPAIVGRWKIAQGSAYLWSSPVEFKADGSSSLGWGTWHYNWTDQVRLELTAVGAVKPSVFGGNDDDYTWDTKFDGDRLILSQKGKTKLVLERID